MTRIVNRKKIQLSIFKVITIINNLLNKLIFIFFTKVLKEEIKRFNVNKENIDCQCENDDPK